MTTTYGTRESFGDISASPQLEERSTTMNVSRTERWISTLSGGLLLGYGVVRLDWPGAGLAVLGGSLLYRGIAGQSAIYRAFDINTARERRTGTYMQIPDKEGVRIQRSITIERTPEDLYALWRRLENASQYTPFVTSVHSIGERRSHWVARGAGEKVLAWDAEIIEDHPNQSFSWQAHGESSMAADAGMVSFAPDPTGRGTIVTLTTDYYRKKGPLTRLLSRIPEGIALETLRRFKALAEAGEVPTIKGQPTGEGRKG